MRKILFRILIVIFLFLVVVLGVAFYQEKTPLNVLQGWFGQSKIVVVEEITPTNDSTNTEEINQEESSNTSIGTGTTGGSETGENISTSQLSEDDKKATEKIINSLIVR